MIKKIFLVLSCITLAATSFGFIEETSNSKETVENKIKNQQVYITRTGKKYHRAGCRYLKSIIPIELKDAHMNGYEPCKVCQPG